MKHQAASRTPTRSQEGETKWEREPDPGYSRDSFGNRGEIGGRRRCRFSRFPGIASTGAPYLAEQQHQTETGRSFVSTFLGVYIDGELFAPDF